MRRRRYPTTHGARFAAALSALVVAHLAEPASATANAPVNVVQERTGSDSDAAIRELFSAVTSQPRGTHLLRLFSLRQLRDPALRPLFEYLLDAPDWTVQVHAVLGLLELGAGSGRNHADPPGVRLTALFAGRHPLAQEAALANALDHGLIDRSRLTIDFDLTALEPPARLLAMAESGALDPSFLVRLSSAEADHIAVLATLLLLESADATALSTLRSRVTACEGGYRGRLLIWALDAIRQFRLATALPFVRDVLSDRPANLDVHFAGVRALTSIAPATVTPEITALLERRATAAHRTRCAMLLLEARAKAPPEAWQLFSDGDPTLQTMRAAGEAMINDRAVSSALKQLAELRHPLVTPWLLSMIRTQPEATAREVLQRIIDLVLADPQHGQAEAALEAIPRLLRLDPQSIIARLIAAEDDSREQELLLLGALSGNHDSIGIAVAGIRRIGVARADALALLLHARYAQMLGPDDARRLELIVSGDAGRVCGLSPGLRSQAAWLHLRHRGRTEEALAAIMIDYDRPTSTDKEPQQ